MKLILNIGLNVGDTVGSVSAAVALEIVKANGLLVGKHAVFQSDTEPTLVVECSTDPMAIEPPQARTWHIASDLGQDCIAALIPNTDATRAIGFLSGPRSSKWGAFNPEFFIMPDGRRFSERLALGA